MGAVKATTLVTWLLTASACATSADLGAARTGNWIELESNPVWVAANLEERMRATTLATARCRVELDLERNAVRCIGETAARVAAEHVLRELDREPLPRDLELVLRRCRVTIVAPGGDAASLASAIDRSFRTRVLLSDGVRRWCEWRPTFSVVAEAGTVQLEGCLLLMMDVPGVVPFLELR